MKICFSLVIEKVKTTCYTEVLAYNGVGKYHILITQTIGQNIILSHMHSLHTNTTKMLLQEQVSNTRITPLIRQ